MSDVSRNETLLRLHKPGWESTDHQVASALSPTVREAATRALETFRGEAHSLFDLRPERRPHLQEVRLSDVDSGEVVGGEGGEDLPFERWFPMPVV